MPKGSSGGGGVSSYFWVSGLGTLFSLGRDKENKAGGPVPIVLGLGWSPALFLAASIPPMSAESGVWQGLAEPGVQGRAGGDLSSGWNVSKDTEAPGGLGIPVCAWPQSQSTAACPSTGRGEQERALPSQTCTPAGPSIFTYGLQDKRDIFQVPAAFEPQFITTALPQATQIPALSEMLGLDFVTSSLSTQCQEGTPQCVCVGRGRTGHGFTGLPG